jgi:intraflagellar transport protein 81
VSKYQHAYKEKKSKQAVLEKELNQFKSENATLKNTLMVLHQEKINTDQKIRAYERKHGVEGLSEMTEKLDQQIETKETVDIMKGKTLEELSVVVQQLQQKIEDKKH